PRTNGNALMNTKLSESSLLHGWVPDPAWPTAVATPNAARARPATTRSQVMILTCSPAPDYALPCAGLPSNVWNARSLFHVSLVDAGASRHSRPGSVLMIP